MIGKGVHMNARKILTAALVAAMAVAMHAETNIYAGMDAETSALIKKADSLIAERKYESAFVALGPDSTNEFIIHKKTEICISYFVQSIGHRMFALKDLEKDEDLYELRSKGGEFSMHIFDPVEAIDAYYKDNKQSMILEKALGDYYYDVGLRYGGNWFEPDATVAAKAVEHYENALSRGFYTEDMLSNCAGLYVGMENFEKAIQYYERLLKENPKHYTASFNLAYCYVQTGKNKEAIKYGEKAIAVYKDNLEYKMDAIMLCSDASYNMGDYKNALRYAEMGLKITDEDYRLHQRLGAIYLAMGDVEKANASVDTLFSFGPENPAATRIVIAIYEGKEPLVSDFFKRSIERYTDNAGALGNLYFHYSQIFLSQKNKKDAMECALLAKESFTKSGAYVDEVKKAVDQLIAQCK